MVACVSEALTPNPSPEQGPGIPLDPDGLDLAAVIEVQGAGAVHAAGFRIGRGLRRPADHHAVPGNRGSEVLQDAFREGPLEALLHVGQDEVPPPD